MSKDIALDEHLLIQKYFSNIGSAFLAEHNVEISVGDDASVISSKQNIQQINSLDTSIEGVHFLSSMSAEDIAYRSCVIALSDLAACGARPKWYSIAIGHPFGMTGSRQVGHLTRELRRTGGKYGIVTMCVGGGMGATGLFESIPE